MNLFKEGRRHFDEAKAREEYVYALNEMIKTADKMLRMASPGSTTYLAIKKASQDLRTVAKKFNPDVTPMVSVFDEDYDEEAVLVGKEVHSRTKRSYNLRVKSIPRHLRPMSLSKVFGLHEVRNVTLIDGVHKCPTPKLLDDTTTIEELRENAGDHFNLHYYYDTSFWLQGTYDMYPVAEDCT